MPKVTVLMPVYNGESFVREAIESILSQTYRDFEFLIINDGSTDRTKDIILSYKDSRIRYIENRTNLKLIATLNKGIELARGEFIVRMDADDVSLADRLNVQVKFMDTNPDVALCGTWFLEFPAKEPITKYAVQNDDIRVRMLHQTQFCHPSVILRAAVLKDNNFYFDLNYEHAEDYELFVRIAEKFKVANVPQLLLKYRIHKTSITSLYNEIQNENTKKIIINQFKHLKTDFTDYDFTLYSTFAYSDFNYFEKQKVKNLTIYYLF